METIGNRIKITMHFSRTMLRTPKAEYSRTECASTGNKFQSGCSGDKK